MNKKILFVFIILIILFSTSIVDKVFQNDTFFTIVVGEKILREGIYEDEDFSWHEGLKYQNVRWIFDITIAKINDLFGFTGIYIFVMIISAIIGLTIFYILVKQNRNIFISFVYTLIALYAANGILAARAQIISFLIFILEYYFIYKLVEESKKRYILYLTILSILLANIHASVYPLFFVLFMPYIAEYILSFILIKNSPDKKVEISRINNIKLLIICMFITAFGGLISPLGLAPYVNMFKTVGEVSSDIIAEMQPLNPMEVPYFIAYIIILFGIIGFTKIKIRIVDGFYLLGFLILSLSNYRSIYFFYLIDIFPIAKLTVQVYEYYGGIEKIDYKITKILIVGISVYIICFSINNYIGNLNADYVDSTAYPVDATKFLLENVDISKMKLYNHFNFGSYLELNGIPVFIDSRAEIYLSTFNNTSVLEDYNKVVSSTDEYKKIFNKYGVTHALIYNTELFSDNIYNNPEWKLIYLDDNFSIYERVDIK